MKLSEKSVILSNAKENFLINWQVLGLAGLLLFALTFCYAQVFMTLVRLWWSNDIYSYGFLIPLISLYLVWIQREKLREIEPAPDYLKGGLLFLSGLSMLAVGQASGIALLEELSLIVTLMGAVLLMWGERSLRYLWFPIAYLLFMVPLWGFITERLHLPFQLFSANMGTRFLQFVGIPAYRNGVYIELPNIVLEVANACSGVNYLIAVIAIGIPMANLFLNGWWRKTALIGFSVTIAAFSNVLRVALIGTLAYYGIGGDLHGPFHILQGLSVSMIGYGAIFAGVWFLSQPSSLAVLVDKAQNSESLRLRIKKQEPIYLVLSVSAILLLIGSYLHFYQRSSVPLKVALENFPVQVGEWTGRETPPDYSFHRNFGVDRELSRKYQTIFGESVRFYIGYYENQDHRKELTHYKMSELHRKAEKIKVSVDGNVIEVNRVVEENGNSKRVTLFWYHLYGRDIADWYEAKKEIMIHSLLKGRTHGAVMMVTADLSHQEDPEKSFARSEAFVAEIRPLLSQFLPQ